MDDVDTQHRYGCAFALARIGLGLNIALHGFTRLPNLEGFATKMLEGFASSPLPPSLVHASLLVIPVVEAVVGTLLLFGVFTERVLLAGTSLMFLLLSGACLSQNWNAASQQMIYLAFFVALVATSNHDRWGIDAWRRHRQPADRRAPA